VRIRAGGDQRWSSLPRLESETIWISSCRSSRRSTCKPILRQFGCPEGFGSARGVSEALAGLLGQSRNCAQSLQKIRLQLISAVRATSVAVHYHNVIGNQLSKPLSVSRSYRVQPCLSDSSNGGRMESSADGSSFIARLSPAPWINVKNTGSHILPAPFAGVMFAVGRA
jgi:hypothetical protein